MREKKRYLLVKPDGVAPGREKAAVESALLEWLGERGVFDAGAGVVRVEPDGLVWVRCAPKAIENVVAALLLKRFFDQKNAALRTIQAAGSVPRTPGRRTKNGRTGAVR